MSDSKPLWRSVQIALVAALVVVAAGMAFALTQQGKYKAETSLIVLPASTLDNTAQASYLETLSRGQIPATMAEVAQSGQLKTEAATAMGLSTTEAASTTVTVTVVPSTSVLLITAEATSKTVAEGLADRTAQLAATYLKSMIKPYTATQVGSAAGTAYPAGTSTTTLLAGVLAAALAVAVAAQQAAYQVLQGRRRTRGPVMRPSAYAEHPGTASPSASAATRPGVASVPAATPTFDPPAATPTFDPPVTTVKASASAPLSSTPTAVGTSPVTSWNAASNDSSPAWGGATEWKNPNSGSASVHTAMNSTYGSSDYHDYHDDDTAAPRDDSAGESGVTNERVLFS